jgi:hypothetical protein
MLPSARIAAVLSALLLCALLAAPALAQKPFNAPKLRDKPKGGFGAQVTATPTVTATASASPSPTVTPRHRHRHADLPNTGADPLRLLLAGFTLIGFGLALRYRVALADARPQV